MVAMYLVIGFKVRPPSFHVGRSFFMLDRALQVEMFSACIFEQLAPCIFPSWRVASEFFCSSQLLIQEAAEVRFLHRLRRAAEPRDPQQASLPGQRE